MKYRLGVDIGGTSVKIAAVDSDFNLTEKLRFPTGENCTSEEIMQNLIKHCREFIEKYDIEAIGVGSAGGIDPKNGLVVTAGNLPFRNEPVVKKLRDAFGIPVFIDNDGNCALVGERAAGQCKGCVDALVITLGTGVGGAVVMDSRIMRGRNNRAGEIGHFVIDRNGPECECGLHGCLERYVSATALIESVEKAVSEHPKAFSHRSQRTASTARPRSMQRKRDVRSRPVFLMNTDVPWRSVWIVWPISSRPKPSSSQAGSPTKAKRF